MFWENLELELQDEKERNGGNTESDDTDDNLIVEIEKDDTPSDGNNK